MDDWRNAMHIRPGHEWDRFEGRHYRPTGCRRISTPVPFIKRGPRRFSAPNLAVPERLPQPGQTQMSTQQGFGLITE